MNLLCLALSVLVGGSSISEQTGWSGSEIINVECPEGPSKSYCQDFCQKMGRNQTVAFMDTHCYPKLPPGSAILVTRDRRYGTGSGKVLYHGNSPDDVYHDRHGFMWGIDFTGDEVDNSHPERIKKAMIYMDLSMYMDEILKDNKMATPNHPVYLYRALLSTQHLTNNQGANQYLEGFHNDNAVVHGINLDHPDYKFLSWDSVEFKRHALNVTDFVVKTPSPFPKGIVLRQPLLEKPVAQRSENYTNRGRDAGLYMDVHEEVWVVADLNCGSYHECNDCLAISECHWCYNSNGKHVCVEKCHKLWTDDQC